MAAIIVVGLTANLDPCLSTPSVDAALDDGCRGTARLPRSAARRRRRLEFAFLVFGSRSAPTRLVTYLFGSAVVTRFKFVVIAGSSNDLARVDAPTAGTE